MLKPEKKLATQQIYHGRAVNIRVDTVEKASGTKTTREVVEHSDCIAVVALDEQGNVLLVRQFRHAVDRFLLEIPAGGIDAGEEPIDSVRRELQEEIGYFPRKIDNLGGFYATPGYGTLCPLVWWLKIPTTSSWSAFPRMRYPDLSPRAKSAMPKASLPCLCSSSYGQGNRPVYEVMSL
jgi:hypothetical protein